jgi:hypothetical protein
VEVEFQVRDGENGREAHEVAIVLVPEAARRARTRRRGP